MFESRVKPGDIEALKRKFDEIGRRSRIQKARAVLHARVTEIDPDTTNALEQLGSKSVGGVFPQHSLTYQDAKLIGQTVVGLTTSDYTRFDPDERHIKDRYRIDNLDETVIIPEGAGRVVLTQGAIDTILEERPDKSGLTIFLDSGQSTKKNSVDRKLVESVADRFERFGVPVSYR